MVTYHKSLAFSLLLLQSSSSDAFSIPGNQNRNHPQLQERAISSTQVTTPTTTTCLRAKKGFSTSTTSSSSPSLSAEDKKRQKSIRALEEWAKSAKILTQDIKVTAGDPIIGGGLGLLTSNTIQPNSVLLQVPTHLTFSTSNSKLDANPQVEKYFTNRAKAYINAPWWAKLAVDLYVCDAIDSRRPIVGGSNNADADADDGETIDMRPWLDSLPREFDTPIRWTEEERSMLQYTPLVSMVSAQEKYYQSTYDTLSNAIDPSSTMARSDWTYEDFLWGADCARSRAFSGAYGGTAFDVKPYALTLLLVAAYVGLDMGSIEQAANGAALVFCGSILKDFVLPKLFQSKKFIICPLIDMANHKGIKEEGNVAFEYFANGYSLSSSGDLEKGREVFISYGPRSNDALLQQYGFVEPDNAHDVYVMPPLREWNIAALEEATGRTFQSGRLQKLERAGLLGGKSLGSNSNDDDEVFEEGVANRGRGVVVTRAAGLDPAIITALRVLVSSEEEWTAVGEAVGNLVTENSGGVENERLAMIAAQKALELELESKATTLEQDEDTWKNRGSLGMITHEMLALQFRMEKKKLLKETIFALSLKS